MSIVDDSNAWAAGEFYVPDSVGNIDTVMYNALHWDGIRWNPRRFSVTYSGTTYLRAAYAVLAFASDDVWLACPEPEHWDGNTLHNVDLGNALGTNIYRLWGRSSNDLYEVGNNGMVAHFDGSSFQALKTGVQSWFWDIYGSGGDIYLGAEYFDSQIRPSGVFKYDNSGFRFLFPDAADTTDFQALRDAFGVWVSPAGGLWAVAEPFVFQPLVSHKPIAGVNPERNFLYCIRGLSDSDVWVGGVGGTVLHFNGQTWKQYEELKAASNAVEYHTAAVKGHIVILGGISFNPYNALLTVGRRPS